jgi:F420-non-reducing hydrogenase iron-sulfur subunit
MSFEPKIAGFLCNWCSYTGADLAGTSRMQYLPNVRVIRVMCSGRIDPVFILRAFVLDADGVLVSGCHFGDCHYQEGNHKAARRMTLLRNMLPAFGIQRDRLLMTYVSASEAELWQETVNNFTEQVRRLGPLQWNAGQLQRSEGLAAEQEAVR